MNPVDFRCRFLPYIRDVLLPIYEQYLRKELCLSISFNQEQFKVFQEFVAFCCQLLNISTSKKLLSEKETDNLFEEEFMQIFPIFETMQKITRIMKDIISKDEITDKERETILNQMLHCNLEYLSQLL